MCGIIGLIGNGSLFSSLKEGLKSLEYRGYDSAGILLCASQEQVIMRTLGSSSNFETDPFPQTLDSMIGLGHNRWATHGSVCIENTHPIENDIAYIVHNGVVENVQDFIIDEEYKGNTDTERILVFFTSLLKKYSPEQALQMIMNKLIGMSVFVFILKSDPNRFYFLRKGLNPLYISADIKQEQNNQENNDCDIKMGLCSDANVLEKWFDSVYVIEDNQCGYVDASNIVLCSENKELNKQKLEKTPDDIEKTHKTWLRTEIDQQSIVLERFLKNNSVMDVILKGNYSQVCFVGCGSAYYAGCIAKHWFQEFGIPSQAILASEFIDYIKVIKDQTYKDALFVFISQSGQTLETIEAASILKNTRVENGCLDSYQAIAIINSTNSTLTQYVDQVIYTNAGIENSVASTKGFTSQLMALGFLLSRMICENDSNYVKNSLKNVVSQLDEIKRNDQLRDICDQYEVLYVLSKGIGVDIAHEMALKIKELTYIHTDSFSASEFKHGPLSLVDEDFLALMLNPEFGAYDRIRANVMEIVSRGGKIIVLTDKVWEDAGDNVTFYVLPSMNIISAPFLYIKFGQELAYSIAIKNKYNIDQPRNLVKSVTVI